jgi:hypothetical protein
MNAKKEDKIEEDAAMRENKEPRTQNKNEILTPPFIVDLLTQASEEEESIAGGWTADRPTQWNPVFEHTQLNKEEQISTWTRMHWERWPPLCLETSPHSKVSCRKMWLRISTLDVGRPAVRLRKNLGKTSFIQNLYYIR